MTTEIRKVLCRTIVLILAFIALLVLVVLEDENTKMVSAEEDEIECSFLATNDTDGASFEITIDNDLAFVADWNEGLIYYNISDPSNPQYFNEYDTAGAAKDVVIRGDYAFVADRSNGMVIIDLSDIESPHKEGEYGSGDETSALFIEGEYAYLADRANGLVIVDISDMSDPDFEAHYDTGGIAYDVVVSGDYAYVADGGNGLLVVDISKKWDPELAGQYDTDGSAREVKLEGNYAYVVGNDKGIAIINISNPENPSLAGEYESEYEGYVIEISGDYAFISDAGLHIINISDPKNPKEVGYYDTISNGINDITISGNTCFMAIDTFGIEIIELQPIAHIDTIRSNPALTTDPIEFVGRGTSVGDIIQYSWRGSVAGDLYNGTKSTFITSALSENQTIYLKVLDEHGLWSEETEMELTFHTRPKAFIDSIGPNPALVTDTIKLDGHGTDAETDIIRYSWYSNISGELYNGTSNKSAMKLPIGKHNISLMVQDEDGVWSFEVSEVLHIRQQPSVELISVTGEPFLIDKSIHFNCIATDDGEIVRYVWKHYENSTDFYNGTDAEFDYQGLPVGTNNFRINVMDNDGLWSNNSYKFVVIKARPTASIVSITPSSVLSGENITFIASGEDEDGEIVRYSWRSNIDGEIYNGSDITFNSSELSIGNHTINLKVQDNEGFWSHEALQNVTIANQPPPNKPPEITVLSHESGDTVSEITVISGTATDDVEVEYVEVSMNNGSWRQTDYGPSPWEYEWSTFELADGPYHFRIRANDGQNYSEIVELTLVANNSIPENVKPTIIITSPANNSKVSGMVTITGTAVDTDGTVQEVQMKIDKGEWQTLAGTDSWGFSWDSTKVTNGNYEISVRAYDGEDYSDVVVWNLKVENKETPPPDDDDDDDPGFGFTLLTIASVLVALVYHRKKKWIN